MSDALGGGYLYFGSLIYNKMGSRYEPESVGFSGGRIVGTSTGSQVRYHVTDYLGSVRAVVDASGQVLEYNNYYPFGGRWQQNGPRFAANRYRYNGKELQVTGNLGLLDYGARMYDPILARWQGCDPAMQLANPFAFSGNNPVLNVDEDGQFFLSFFSGFIRGLIKGENPLKTGWKGVTNKAKIVGGLFAGNFKQILSRLTWELPQTFLGFSFNYLNNEFGLASNVKHYDGATVVNIGWFGKSAFTLGSYISGGSRLEANPSNALFQHEYGHYLQSQAFGPFYLGKFGIPSLLSMITNGSTKHKYYKTEQDANVRALKYWEKKFPGFSKDEVNGWQRENNPIIGFDWKKDYYSHDNQQALQNGLMKGIKPYDLLSLTGLPGILSDGVINYY